MYTIIFELKIQGSCSSKDQPCGSPFLDKVFSLHFHLDKLKEEHQDFTCQLSLSETEVRNSWTKATSNMDAVTDMETDFAHVSV